MLSAEAPRRLTRCSVQDLTVPVRYDNDGEWKAREAWQYGVALTDRSHWGRLRLAGADRLRFLHAQSTQAIEGLQAGTGAQTVRCDCCMHSCGNVRHCMPAERRVALVLGTSSP
jgi:glycine cleavage system aminomethyltransferase T